jgi:histidinol-phosphate aminotransferase
MKHLVRKVYAAEGYVYATRAEDIARSRGFAPYARLSSNENPFPPEPTVIEAAARALGKANRYPPESADHLIAALQARYGKYPFVVGAGMDGIIETVVRLFIEKGDRAVIATPTFSFYGIALRGQGGEPVTCPRNTDFSIDPAQFLAACDGAKLAFLCTPNNPTGNATPPQDIRRILDGFDGILFLDNAYVEYSMYDYVPLLEDHENLIIGRTFSKVHSLAGMRAGYAFVPEWLPPYFRRAQTPFAVNAATIAAAHAALQDRGHEDRSVAHVRKWRERFIAEIPFRTFPSDANFVLVDVRPNRGDLVTEQLAARGVVVRSCAGFPSLGTTYIRVSIGDDWENERFLAEIKTL